MADMLHLASIIILLMKIRQSRNCIGKENCIIGIGISAKTQELYVIIFCLRYLDLFMYFVSWYNTIMKIGFISATLYILYMIRWKKPYCSVYSIIIFIDLRKRERWLWAFIIFATSFLNPNPLHSHKLVSFRIDMEFQLLAWSFCNLPSTSRFKKAWRSWEYNFPLRCSSRSLQAFLYS